MAKKETLSLKNNVKKIDVKKVAFLTFLGYGFFSILLFLGVASFMDYVNLVRDREVKETRVSMR